MDSVADVSEVPGAFIFVVEGGKMYLRNDHNTDNMRAVQRQTTIFSVTINRRANLESTRTSRILYDRYDERSLFLILSYPSFFLYHSLSDCPVSTFF
jgi:hypothetical protein